jgi:hypothetical protein
VGALLTPAELDGKIVDLVARAREEHGIPEGCDGATACARLGLRLRRASVPRGTDGMLSDGLVVVSNSISWAPRVEFTIYHEITHHLLDEDGEIIEHFTALLRNNEKGYEREIERCCHKGAAEFLMPRARVSEAISEEGLNVDLIEILADRHGASLIASTLQLAHCAPVDCLVVLCSHGAIPRSWPPSTGLYTDYVGAWPRRRYPLARFSPVGSDHVLARAWQNRCRAEGRAYVPYRSGKREPAYCEAKPLGPFVAGILSFQEPPPKGQLTLDL